MSNKNYLVFVLLLATIAGLVLNINSSPQPIANPTKQIISPAGDVKVELKQKIFTQKISTTDELVAHARATNISDSNTPKHERKKDTDIENIEPSEVEPANSNADLLATGEFSDQVNLIMENNDCQESCASNADVNIPAVGEFADQINADIIFKQAMLKNPELQQEIKLTEFSVNSHPSTELGTYTPPPLQ